MKKGMEMVTLRNIRWETMAQVCPWRSTDTNGKDFCKALNGNLTDECEMNHCAPYHWAILIVDLKGEVCE